MRRPTLVLLSLFVAACGSRAEDTAPEGELPDPEGPECSVDGDCASTEICEADACVDGDRNDDVESAEALLWEETVEGEINPVGEVDWYAIQAEGGEFLRVSVVTAEQDGGLDSVVSLYTSAGKRLAWEDEHPAGNVSSADSMLFAYFPEAGTYYVKVEDRGTFYGDGPVGGPGETYTLQVSEWNSVGQEPDSAQDAGLDFGETAINTLYSFPVLVSEAGDVDWGVLELPAAGSPLYVVAMEHDEESELTANVEIYNEAGDPVLSIVDPTAAASGLLPNPAGTKYVVGVGDEAGGGGADHWTWLFFVIREAGSGNPAGAEPDDIPQAANLVTLEDQEADSGTWFAGYGQGTIESGSDVDFYQIDVPFDGAYVTAYVGAQRYGSLLVPRMELLDEEGASLALVDSTPGADENAVNLGPFDTGTYYLAVTSADDASEGGEGSFYLFGLHVTSFELD